MWVKIWRDSSAMPGRPHYAEYENDEDLKQLLEYYDDLIYGDGLHYLKHEKIDKPPKDWLKKELHRFLERLKNLYSDYKANRRNLHRVIAHYKQALRDLEEE